MASAEPVEAADEGDHRAMLLGKLDPPADPEIEILVVLLQQRLVEIERRRVERGTKEMDLILGAFADARLGLLDPETLDRYEALLEENDQDLYLWISRGEAYPDTHTALIGEIRAFHGLN